MPKYKVKSPLSHDGEDYKIGDTVEMTAEQAAPLLGHALARPGEELTEKQVAQGVSAVESEAARLVELREQLTAERLELRNAQEQLASARDSLDAERDRLSSEQQELQKALELLAADQGELEAGRKQLVADRAEFDKAVKAGSKK